MLAIFPPSFFIFSQQFPQCGTHCCYSVSICWLRIWGLVPNQWDQWDSWVPFVILPSRNPSAEQHPTQHPIKGKPEYAELAGKQPNLPAKKDVSADASHPKPASWVTKKPRVGTKGRLETDTPPPFITLHPSPPKAAVAMLSHCPLPSLVYGHLYCKY